MKEPMQSGNKNGWLLGEMVWDLIEKPSSEELMNLPDEGIFLTTDDLMLSVLYCFVHIYWAKNGSEAFLEKVIEEIKNIPKTTTTERRR